MYISAFHIDGFGLYSNVQVSGLAPGITIFYGSNEAGKSTCLEFLRCILMDYPSRRGRTNDRYKPQNGGNAGGSLTLNVGADFPDGPEIRLHRHPESSESLTLFTPAGKHLPNSALDGILAGITRDVYIKVFGFSLSELENFENLSEKGVREALYAASFSPGLNSPSDVSRKINEEMGSIFKARGKKTPLNLDFLRLESIGEDINRIFEANAEFEAESSQLNNLEKELEKIAASKNDTEKELRKLERRLSVWVQWEQWSSLKRRLETMEKIDGHFPENATDRLIRIQEARTARESSVAAIRKKLENVTNQIESFRLNQALLLKLPQLKRLSERKTSYRQALEKMPSLMATVERTARDLAHNLSQLGPDWNCERIRSINRTLFTRETMEKSAAELTLARIDKDAATTAAEKATSIIKRTAQDLDQARKDLEEKKEPDADLAAPERDQLRSDMDRLENYRRQYPGRQQAFENAKIAFARSLSLLGITMENENAGIQEINAIGSRLRKLTENQGKALALADEAVAVKLEEERVVAELNTAEHKVGELQKLYYESRKESMALASPTAENLEEKINELRELRAISRNMDNEKERLRELDERIQSEKSFRKQKNWVLLSLGLIFLLAAAGIFCAHWIWHLSEFQFQNGISIPLNLSSVYIPFFCGFILLALGMPWDGAEQKRRKKELAILESRRENCSMHLAELGTKAQQLCEKTQVDNLGAEALNMFEASLEKDKIRLVQDQQLQISLGELKKREENAKIEASRLKEICQETNSRLQQSRKRWHELMRNMEIDIIPMPEQAEIFFTRVESAATACDNVLNAQRELDALWSDLNNIETAITSLPAVRVTLDKAGGAASLTEAVQLVLKSCADADLIREERIHLQANLRNLENQMAREEAQQEEAIQRLEKSQNRYIDASEAWKKSLENLGLGEDLAPETAREALTIMEKCLQIEGHHESALEELEQAKAELAALQKPLAEIRKELSGSHIPEDEEADWLAFLDENLKAGEEAIQLETLRNQEQRRLAELQNDLAAEIAALDLIIAKEDELLKQANVDNPDAFLHFARLQEDRIKLEKDLKNLEFSLASAAKGIPLEEFLKDFETETLESQEKQLEKAKNTLRTLNEEENTKISLHGELKGKLKEMATENRIADLRQEQTMLMERATDLANKWNTLAIADALLQKARSIYEKERQPEVIRLASGIFKKITNGQWIGMGASMDDDSLMMIPSQGKPVGPETLSRGAQEQAYLALRLAFIQNRSETAPSLPVIMDEILVNFDPSRAERAAAAIADLASNEKGGPQQVFYFTCQPYMVDILKSASPHSPVYTVENRQIFRN